MPIFGPNNELTNETPGPPLPGGPAKLPNRLPIDEGQPSFGIACVIELKMSVAPLGEEASAAAEPSRAGTACSSAALVPSGLSPTDLLICPSVSGEICSRIM